MTTTAPKPLSKLIPATINKIDYSAKLAWRVEPVYDYAYYTFWAGIINYGYYNSDGKYSSESNLMLNVFTGEIIEGWSDFPTGGLPPPDEWLYDEEKKLFCLYGTNKEYSPADFMTFTPDEFTAFFDDNTKDGYFSGDELYFERFGGSNRLRAFRRINSEKVIQKEYYSEANDAEFCYDLSEAYIDDKYALVYGTEFMTEFIYDIDLSKGKETNIQRDVIAVKSGGKFGIVGKDGKVAVPFITDGIIFINSDIAFAFYEGAWGILDINETALLQ